MFLRKEMSFKLQDQIVLKRVIPVIGMNEFVLTANFFLSNEQNGFFFYLFTCNRDISLLINFL